MEEVKEVSEVLVIDPNSDLSQLHGEATKIQEKCSDFYVTRNASSKTTNLHFDGEKNVLNFQPDEGEVQKLPLSDLAFGQLCTKLEVPSRYIERCLKEGVGELAEENLNYWLENYKGSLFIRKYDNLIRGILSNRFSVLDAPDILSGLMEFLSSKGELTDYKVKGHFLSPERFHVRLVNREPIRGFRDKDLFAGLQVDSSDVGRSTLTVQFILYKQVCTNGLVIPKSKFTLFDQKHMGITSESLLNGLDSYSTMSSLVEDARDLIHSANEHSLDRGVEIEELIKREDYMDFPLSSRLKAGLTKEEILRVYTVMNESYDSTQWGLVNSITQAAQGYTLERRLAMERFAGSILTSRF